MSNATANPRANRFRKVASQSLLLPPPLPLINLPEESRLARTGIQSQRPMHLPVRRHIPNPVAVAALKAKADGGPKNPEDFDHLQPPKSEPILHESRALLECEDEEYEELEVLARLHVYEYNQPDVFRDSSAPDDTLIFDSLFEGGNLQRAERIFRKTPTSGSASHMPQHEYELLIHPDIKNGAYRQWFYFEVRNGRPGTTYRFALVNLAKSGALFGQGLQPVVYSEHDAVTKGVGWRHRGSHVRYDVATSPTAQPGANALTFHYEFEHENDCVYFACIQPYTYTDLMDYLEHLERDPQRSLTCRRTELCQSLAGNQCDLLTITSPAKDGIPHDERRIIVLSARVHPGEPNSSWMMQGMVDYLTGPSSGATILRRNFIFKIVPMLNPDGVINGNTRVSLAGWDLNRKWGNPIEQLFPTVYHLKQQLAHFQAHGRVAIYCDLHGHSINRNIFTYGCYTSKKRPSASDSAKSSADAASATSPASNTVKTDPRVFPMIVARHAPCFSFASCDFSVHKSKLTTARVVVNQELGVTNSYTLEASFCGPDFGTHKDTQFSTWDLEEMGRSWCQSLLVYYGLTAQVKALDAERERQAAVDERVQTSMAASSPNGRQTSRTRPEHGSMRMEAEDEESRLARDLLLDCEAAISALFAHSGMDISDRVESDDDAGGGMDSDMSGAEEEPIPPSPDGRARQRSPQIHSEREKQPDNDALVDDEGYSSAPEDFPSRKSRTSKSSHTRKKAGRRKHTRTNATKQKSAAIPTSRRGEGKSKKKKKRKSKSELRRTTLPIAASSLGPKLEDAAPCIAEEPPDIVVRSPPVDEVLKTFPKKMTTSRRSKSKSRPKSSYETPRSITSAILKATMNVDLVASRASLRLRPMPEYPNTSNTLLVLPSVLDGGSRNGSVRILKTAPSYDQEYATLEDKTRFSLARVRSELPALQNSGRDEGQQRHSRLRVQENDDIRSDEGSDSSSERSEPEAYPSSF